MSKTAEHGGSAPAEASFDGISAIVGDLLRLIEHVQSSIAAIEVELARELLCSSPEHTGNVIVLDDVTPRYARASAALSACRATLTTALRVLADNRGSAQRSQPWG
jgi:hypothetical protein